ncbi:MAG: tRNA epoxyqueuosine(34) reductase QueG [Epulopiscium sp.]|nr:tRNA epoxyqueuosine(34) reductase QueG [Candidatus Epulonipiscium sp.]
MNIKELCIQKSKEFKIDIIGFTSAAPFSYIEETLLNRQKKGYLSGFEEKDIKKRIDPCYTFPNAKTIIAVGEGYHVNWHEEVPDRPYGKLSKAAWGLDYHAVLKNKLNQLSDYLQKNLGGDYKAFVDTGPLIDREVAKRAGLGWQGKNCSVISPILGSWFFIGYLITDIEIEPDYPCYESYCETCDLCQKVCPTNALCKDYEMNAKKCISYLTQTKEEISPILRGKMGRQLYGCDLCQSICPYNQQIPFQDKSYFYPLETSAYPDLEQILTMSNKTFNEIYGSTASAWRGKPILQRNALIALANNPNSHLVPLVQSFLQHPNVTLQKTARWTLQKIED